MTDQNYNTFPRIRTIHGINYLCNSDLSTCIPLLYDYVASPCEEVIVVAKGGFQDDCKEYVGGKYGLIDLKGKEILPLVYDYIFNANQGTVMLNRGGQGQPNGGYLCKGGKWGFCDLKGQVITPCRYDNADFFDGDYARVCVNRQWGFIDRSGKEVIPTVYRDLWNFSEGLARFRNSKGLFGFIAKNGKEVIAGKYEDATDFLNKNACVCCNKKWGVIDTAGRLQTELKYDEIEQDKYDWMQVRIGNCYGYIDYQGHEKIPVKYHYLSHYIDDYAEAKIGDHYGLIDRQGVWKK